MSEEPSVNSEQFWDSLFHQSWETRQGREQTKFFAKVALDHFPPWFVSELSSHPYSICDVGCALGDALPIFQAAFPNAILTGIDFSHAGISKARELYSDFHFEVVDLNQMTTKHDVIYSSNTLEHFHDPFPLIEKLMAQANKYLILLLPFQDDTGTYEHFFRFDYEHFPETIEEGRLTFLKEIDCRLLANTYWNAKQVLAIYQKR